MHINGAITVLIGILFITIGIMYGFSSLLITVFRNRNCTLNVSATIIDIQEKVIKYRHGIKLRQTSVYVPTLQYIVDGVFYTCNGNADGLNIRSIGDKEVIFCNPNKPKRVLHYNKGNLNILIGFIIWLLLGIGSMLFSLI